MINIILYEDHIDKDTIRDDILAEIYDKLNEMSIQEIIEIRNKIFANKNESQIIYKPSKEKDLIE